MTISKRAEARRRMSRLIVTDEIQNRIDRLNVSREEFSADLLSAVASSAENADLNESEVFAIFELSAKMGLRIDGNESGARLDNLNGHAAITMDFANLFNLFKRMRCKNHTA